MGGRGFEHLRAWLIERERLPVGTLWCPEGPRHSGEALGISDKLQVKPKSFRGGVYLPIWRTSLFSEPSRFRDQRRLRVNERPVVYSERSQPSP